ncbi:MAG: Gfo/Idh/MocA family oxidoreductase [Bacteroidetes bacterium]|nr:Gfo/Idh/MocA family oxidoreductase [Bacteroidota bacterium]MBU1678578.1 Gfo/Idh/MocA family oxidoreductase [Bacteroidota bacterium]MBU2505174.1 Gfo/Idh/MocA family oxidoreductase [Bacteroidota bacterium]
MKLPLVRSKKLKWGVAGCGNYLENTFLPALTMLKKNKLISVYSSDLNRAAKVAKKFNAEKSFNNFADFLNSDFDILYISSVNSNHHWQVIEAAKKGKHILCEKPLALSSAQADEMIEICKQNNVFLTINYVFRYHPLVIKAKELIDNHLIGKIVSIDTHFNTKYVPNDNYRFNKKESGGGALRDLGTHMIDLLRFFGGEIVNISGIVDNVIYKSEVDDFANAIVKFERGGYGSFNVSFNTQKAFNRIEILGSNGSISIDNIIANKFSPGKLSINLKSEVRKAFRKRANKQLYLLRAVQKSILKHEQPQITGHDGLVNIVLMERLEQQCL